MRKRLERVEEKRDLGGSVVTPQQEPVKKVLVLAMGQRRAGVICVKSPSLLLQEGMLTKSNWKLQTSPWE